MFNPFDGSQLCAQVNPDLFFPEDRKNWKSNIAQAKTLCAQCPMLVACRTYANGTVGLYGIWAGEWRDGSGYVTPIPMDRKVA